MGKNDSENIEFSAKYILQRQIEDGDLECCLDHSGDPRPEGERDLRAINILCIPVDNGHITIPICSVCQYSLQEMADEWILFVCLGCTRTHWAHRSTLSRWNRTEENVMVLKSCPHCGYKIKI